jgi:ribosomal protein S12 methylthiotransferase accessory factor YcaO
VTQVTRLRLRVLTFAPMSGRIQAKLAAALRANLAELERRWAPIEFDVHNYGSPETLGTWTVLAASPPPSDTKTSGLAAGGASSLDAEEAVNILTGELNERIAATRFKPTKLHLGSARELSRSGRLVFDFEAHLGRPLVAERWRFRDFDPNAAYLWTTAESLATQSEVWIPYSFVATGGPEKFCELTSVGCASAPSAEDGVGRAVAELKERDALRIAWYSGLQPTEVTNRETLAEIEEIPSQADWQSRLMLLPISSGEGVSMHYMCSPKEKTFSIGTALGALERSVVYHATREAMQGKLDLWLNGSRPIPSSVITFADHAMWYCRSERFQSIETFFRSQRVLNDGLSRDLSESETVNDLDPADSSVIPPMTMEGGVFVRLSEDDRPCVVRVVLPECQSLEGSHDSARVSKRALSICTNGTVRLDPHPFG